MELELVRFWPTSECILGALYVDGSLGYYTLERSADDPDFKPIPEGTYGIAILPSIKFGKPMMHVLDVPGRTAIEIHPGNTAKDTHGCILVGMVRLSKTSIGESDLAESQLKAQVKTALDAGKPVNITVRQPVAETYNVT